MSKQSKVKSSLRLKSKTPLQKDEVHKINTILMHLNNHNDSMDFREPVDWRALGLDDYPDVVKHPMDLSTINTKIKDKRYKTVESVLNDIQLIWDNCKLYNKRGSDIYEIADKLQLNFRRMVRNYLPHLKVATVTSVPIRPITEPPFIILFKPERNVERKPSYNMRKQFVEKLSDLSQQNLFKVINCVKEVASTNFVEAPDGWAKIEVETIENTAFTKILQFLNALNGSLETNQMV